MNKLSARIVAGLALALVAAVVGVAPSASAVTRAEEPKADQGASVGLRTATASGGDRRGHYDFEIPPRGRVVDYVAVSNLRYEPITVRLFGKDATTTTDTAFAIQESEEKPADVGAWLSLGRQRVTLPPRSETIIPFQLGVPFNAEPGDHAGAIVVSLLAKKPKAGGGNVIVDHRVALRVLLRVPGELEPELTVTGVEASWDSPGTALGRGDAVVTYTVRNTGNIRLSATGGVELDRRLGPSVDAPTAPIDEIQPGGEMQVRQRIADVLGTGPATARVILDPTPVDPKLAELEVPAAKSSASFWAVPWILVAIVLAVLLALTGGGLYDRRRRRARRAAMTPTGGSHRSEVVPDSRPAEPALNRGRRARLARLAAAFASATVLVVPTGSAGAADEPEVWQATLSVRQGTDNVPIDLITTGGCPLPGTNVVGFAYGTGFPKEGGVVIGNGDAGVDARGPFRMPLVASLAQLMAEQPKPKPFSGTYRLELRCVTPDLATVTGRYVVALRFTGPHRWKVAPPLTTDKGPVTNATDAPAPSGDPTGSSQGAPSTNPNAPSAEELAQAQRRAEELASASDGDADAGGGPSWTLIGAGVLVLLATGALVLRRAK